MLSKRRGSSAQTSILFYFEANEKLGLGHLYRCCSIATELTEQAKVDIFVLYSEEKVLRSVFEGLPHRLIEPEEICEGVFFDVVITDIPELSYESQQFLKKICKLLIGIDDSGEGPFDYDVIIRPNFLQLPMPRMTRASAQIWAGRDYIILHPAFSKFTPSADRPDKAKELLICFGGSDPGGFTLRVVPPLRQLPNEVRINMIVGPVFTKFEQLISLVGNEKRFTLLRNVLNLAELFGSCGASVISGGTLMYEACSLAVPSIIMCQNAEQDKEAAIFAEQNAVINLGYGAKVCDERILEAVMRVCFDLSLREQLWENAKRMVCTDGAHRIVKKILHKLGCKVS
jgi:spore coat polysaccharide biosynthesis predicted glycosyltransferase SpsG